ncbi:unnamed protein product [Urochloa humidicola]
MAATHSDLPSRPRRHVLLPASAHATAPPSSAPSPPAVRADLATGRTVHAQLVSLRTPRQQLCATAPSEPSGERGTTCRIYSSTARGRTVSCLSNHSYLYLTQICPNRASRVGGSAWPMHGQNGSERPTAVEIAPSPRP